MTFFEKHNDFLSNNGVGSDINRLNYRYNCIIKPVSFVNKSVLDLGSHDGRWALAALDAGALHVTCVEYNKELLTKSKRLASKYNYTSIDFVNQDIIEFLRSTTERFDIILCCGVFYHTLYHLEYFKYMSSIFNDYIILDTCIYPTKDPIISIQLETSTWPGNSYSNINPISVNDQIKDTIVGIPSEAYIEILCKSFSLNYKKIDNINTIINQHKLCDYLTKQRYTYIINKND